MIEFDDDNESAEWEGATRGSEETQWKPTSTRRSLISTPVLTGRVLHH